MIAPVTRNPNRGVELGFIEKTDSSGNTATTIADVAGLTVTVTVGNRPIIVEAGGELRNNNAGGAAFMSIVQDGTTTIQKTQPFAANAGQEFNVCLRRRLSLAPGSYAFKVRIAGIVAGTTTLNCTTDQPAWLQVTEV